VFVLGQARPTAARDRVATTKVTTGRQRLAVVAAGSAVGLVRSRKRIGLRPAVATPCAFGVPVALAAGFKRSPVRDAAVWAAQMWAYKNAFEMPNDQSGELRRRVHVDYPLAADAWLGRGVPVGRRLQRALRTHGKLSVLDKAVTFFYWTWEAEPHLAMAWIRRRYPDSFPAAAGRLAATFNATLLGYWLVPTAPPWWASEELRRMDGEVRRVMYEVANWVKRKPDPTGGDHEMGANPFAAMPSDHFASAAMTAILLGERNSRLGALAWGYALALAFALVYLGEHYVTDLLAGLALALTLNGAARPLERLAERVLSLGSGR
jgi:membrane-associated phospholipid phosphatase